MKKVLVLTVVCLAYLAIFLPILTSISEPLENPSAILFLSPVQALLPDSFIEFIKGTYLYGSSVFKILTGLFGLGLILLVSKIEPKFFAEKPLAH